MNASQAASLPFNPDVFRWARERIGLPVEAVAKRVPTSVDRLVDWEDRDAERRPTVKQARRLATIYGRPFLEFFAREIPNVPDVDLVPDFRFHRTAPPEMEIVALEKIQRWAEEQRLNALDLLELVGEDAPRLPSELYATTRDDVEEVARNARNITSFPIERQFALKAAERRLLPDMLREVFSDCGVLVLRRSGLSRNRTRGICFFAEPLPIILYGNEAPGAQAFTLAHEFGHVLLRRSAISGGPRFGRVTDERKRIEGWCNRFAAAFLVPADALAQALAKPDRPQATIDDDILGGLAEQFAISRHAMLIRFVNLNYVDPNFYWRTKRPQFIREEEAFEAPFMRSKYYGSRYKNSLGDYYTGLVLEAWETGTISGHNAAEFMGIKNLEHLDAIRRNFRG